MIREKIEAFCQSLGLDTVGFIPCRTWKELEGFYDKRQKEGLQNEFEEPLVEKRINSNKVLQNAKTIISIAFPYYHEGEEAQNGFSTYTKRADYHKVVRSYLESIANYIEGLGGQARCFVDSNALPERYIAYLAGVGFIGKNNMLITKKYGSYVFLGEIITDLEVPCEEQRSFDELEDYKECGDCQRCMRQCPTKAIAKEKRNPNICLSYLTQKKELTDEEMHMLKGNLFGCDYCQIKCPYNEEIETSVLREFKTLVHMNEEVAVYAGMDNAFFKQKISGTSCGWRGKNVIKRNAMLYLAHKGQSIEEFVGDSPYLRAYAQKLKNK